MFGDNGDPIWSTMSSPRRNAEAFEETHYTHIKPISMLKKDTSKSFIHDIELGIRIASEESNYKPPDLTKSPKE